MPIARDIEGTVFHTGSATLLARVVGADAEPITADSLTAASYTIDAFNEGDDRAAIVVDGHGDVDLTPADVLFDELQTDAQWTVDDQGYNFRHEIDVTTDPAFPNAGIRYRVTYRLTPTEGQVIIVRFSLYAI